MTNEEILTKTIEKAVAQGWLKVPHREIKSVTSYFDSNGGLGVTTEFDELYKGYWNENYFFGSVEALVFAHDFAKAVWGELVVCASCGTMWSLPSHCCSNMENEATSLRRWQYHLQQLVLEENPLEYLAKFLDQTEI